MYITKIRWLTFDPYFYLPYHFIIFLLPHFYIFISSPIVSTSYCIGNWACTALSGTKQHQLNMCYKLSQISFIFFIDFYHQLSLQDYYRVKVTEKI